MRDRIALVLAVAGFGFYVALGSDLALASGTALLVFYFRDYLDGPPFCPRCGRGMRE